VGTSNVRCALQHRFHERAPPGFFVHVERTSKLSRIVGVSPKEPIPKHRSKYFRVARVSFSGGGRALNQRKRNSVCFAVVFSMIGTFVPVSSSYAADVLSEFDSLLWQMFVQIRCHPEEADKLPDLAESHIFLSVAFYMYLEKLRTNDSMRGESFFDNIDEAQHMAAERMGRTVWRFEQENKNKSCAELDSSIANGRETLMPKL
jgi:hypothetical protein